MSGTRVTAVEVVNPRPPQSVEIVDDYVIIADGSAQVTGIQVHSNGTHVITVKGVRRRLDAEVAKLAGGGDQ